MTDDKLAIASEALETCAKFRDGRVLITMDARSPGAHAPELPGWSRHEFTFAIGLRMQAPTLVDDYGVTACLSFKGEVHVIRAPWSSIWRIASADDAAGFVYIDEGAEPLESKLAHEDSAPPKAPAQALPSTPTPPGGNVIPFRRPG
jgi:hypothetical protein